MDQLAATQNLSVAGAGGAGNADLNDAFKYAINQAQTTLNITTKRGADLYAVKQRPQ